MAGPEPGIEVLIMNLKKIMLLGAVGLGSAAIGILIPTVIPAGHVEAKAEKPAAHDSKASAEHSDAHGAAAGGHEAKKPDDHGGHGAKDAHGGHDAAKKVDREGPQFLVFGQMVVNLNEPLLTKVLSLDVAIQTDGKYYDEVEAALKAKSPILKTWLTSHLADKTIEDIRGKVGVNRLRREIQDNFNSLLFKDGHERIQDIMFEEYHVQ